MQESLTRDLIRVTKHARSLPLGLDNHTLPSLVEQQSKHQRSRSQLEHVMARHNRYKYNPLPTYGSKKSLGMYRRGLYRASA